MAAQDFSLGPRRLELPPEGEEATSGPLDAAAAAAAAEQAAGGRRKRSRRA